MEPKPKKKKPKELVATPKLVNWLVFLFFFCFLKFFWGEHPSATYLIYLFSRPETDIKTLTSARASSSEFQVLLIIFMTLSRFLLELMKRLKSDPIK